MTDTAQYLYAFAGIFASLYFIYWRTQPLYRIPAIGPSAPFLSYLGAYRYYRNAQKVLQEGYSKHKVFKVSLLDKWIVVVSGADMNEELRKVPDTHVSFPEAVEELLQMRHTVAPEVSTNPIHINVVRGPLTRNLGLLFPDVIDEIDLAFPEAIRLKGDEWVSISVMETMAKVVSRASNRVFVGLPLCRDPEFLSTVVNFAFAVSLGRDVLSVVPGVFRGVAGRLLPWSKRAIRKTSEYIEPIIQERLQKLQELGDDWPDKPDDYLMWLIEEAHKVGRGADLVVQGMLVSNFAAIHTSSHSITHSLYNLAANPQYMQPLREEVEAVIHEHGWTKVGMGKMWKLDSFMRESQRLAGISGISVMRKVLQGITLSDGTYLPKGTIVVAAAAATHQDERYYENPEAFDPFRFSDMRAEESEKIRHQYINTSGEFIPFGHGKHACPGRFFAVNELKVMMAYIIINYDMKFEDGVGRPDNMWIWHDIAPSNVKVMFRKRQVAKV